MGLSLMNMLGISSSVHFTHTMLLNISSFCTTHKSSISTGFTEQIMPVLPILCYNGSLVTWTVIGLTTAKFKLQRDSLYSRRMDHTENTAPLLLVKSSHRKQVPPLMHVDHIYWAVAWQRIDQIRYNIKFYYGLREISQQEGDIWILNYNRNHLH
jgi:hypothetical protein